jgi:hypothetical protein
MKYMLLIYSPPMTSAEAAAAMAEPLEGAEAPPGESMADWMAYDKSVKESGAYVSGEALADLTTATRVRVGPGGDRSITTDGPFAETREILGGFYVIDVPDLDAALDWAARCPGALNGGSMIVRPVVEFDI